MELDICYLCLSADEQWGTLCQKILYVQTSEEDAPERAYASFVLGTTAVAMVLEAKIEGESISLNMWKDLSDEELNSIREAAKAVYESYVTEMVVIAKLQHDSRGAD